MCGKIVNFTSNGLIKNAQIPYYDFSIDFAEEKGANVAISKKGGHIIYASLDRKVEENKISQEEAGEKAKEFLHHLMQLLPLLNLDTLSHPLAHKHNLL